MRFYSLAPPHPASLIYLCNKFPSIPAAFRLRKLFISSLDNVCVCIYIRGPSVKLIDDFHPFRKLGTRSRTRPVIKIIYYFFFLPFFRKNETAVKSFRFVPIEINYDSRAPATRDGNVDVYVETRNKNLDEMYSDYEDQVSDFLEFFGIFLFLVY